MGNTCTCFNEDNKDREEFESLATDRKNREHHAITIQKNFRGYKARKQYQEMKHEALGGYNHPNMEMNATYEPGAVDES